MCCILLDSKMNDFEFADSENPTFRSWKWMISEEENDDELIEDDGE